MTRIAERINKTGYIHMQINNQKPWRSHWCDGIPGFFFPNFQSTDMETEKAEALLSVKAATGFLHKAPESLWKQCWHYYWTIKQFYLFKILPIKITVRRCLISSLRSAHLSKSGKLIIFPSFSGVWFCFIVKASDSIKMLSKIKGASNFCEGGLGKRVFNLYVEERMK